MRRRCAVLGSPVSHSLSPVLHRAAYAAWDLDWDYDAIEIDQPELAGFLDSLGGEWRGLSLTRPLKRLALDFVDAASPLAQRLGVANTVLIDGGRRFADNTDVPGIVDALRHRGVSSVETAAVVGAGATAASALGALARLGARSATVLARDLPRAGWLVELGARLPLAVHVLELAELERMEGVDVALSTVPATAAEAVAARLVERSAAVFDVLYDPWPTPLAACAAAAGALVVGGLDLLVFQAAHQVELMTGRTPAPLPEMRVAVSGLR
jgi:shikimate dehydrogenase